MKHLQIHATRTTAGISQPPPQKIHGACFDRYSLQYTYRGDRITALTVEVAALFRKTDWESGRGVLPCWKAESAPRATTKALFSAEACSAYQYSRSAWFFQTVVQKSLTEYFLNRIHACAHLILYEKFNRKILCNCITRPPLYYRDSTSV